MNFHKHIVCAGIGAILLAAQSVAWAAELAPVLQRPAQQAAHPERAVLLDIDRAGDRLVAIGERGLIIYSDDQGATWQQASSPVSATLVALTFPDPQNGWAVGHSGVVLHSEDAGVTWQLQLDGNRAAQIALESARSAGDARQEKLAQLLVSDGPDKPFLDVVFTDNARGWIVGAYGLIFRTTDGGKNWTSWLDRVDNPGGMHLYALRYDPQSEGKRIYLAGEQGYFARSVDGGEHFEAVPTPYEGSFFDLAVLRDSTLVLGGLRGNLWRSTNRGESFEQLAVDAPISWNTVTPLDSGQIVLLNQAGGVYVMDAADAPLKPVGVPSGLPLTALVAADDKRYVAVGLGGVSHIDNLGAPELQASQSEVVTP